MQRSQDDEKSRRDNSEKNRADQVLATRTYYFAHFRLSEKKSTPGLSAPATDNILLVPPLAVPTYCTVGPIDQSSGMGDHLIHNVITCPPPAFTAAVIGLAGAPDVAPRVPSSGKFLAIVPHAGPAPPLTAAASPPTGESTNRPLPAKVAVV